ncbi:hypothetical protein K449DRAFT_430195 [Hypoxylon sp. EC38]|nr:hypothetical protein K449DRAFT_430195 [Hypoxylon sp. EC38]
MQLDQTQSPFFRLPGEIRNIIYGYCRPKTSYIELPNREDNWPEIFPPWRISVPGREISPPLRISDLPNLLITCKQAYKEANSILCDAAFFRVVPNCLFYLHAVGNFHPTQLRHLSISYCCHSGDRGFLTQYIIWLSETPLSLRSLRISCIHALPRNYKPGECPCAIYNIPPLVKRRFDTCIPMYLGYLTPCILGYEQLQSIEIQDILYPAWIKSLQDQLAQKSRSRQVKVSVVLTHS